jgi:hypothetical protein
MELVTVVNRSSKPVKGMWDGKVEILAPHAKGAFTTLVAEAFKRQNAVMGSEDPFTGEMQYLVGIVEQGDPITPIEQTAVITRMNRGPMKKNEEVVKGDNGIYSVRDVAASLPLDSVFKPA